MTAAVAASLIVAGCSGSGGEDSGGETVQAVATTTQVADVVREVGGESVEVTQILQPNTDPHDYEPRPSDVEAVSGADVVFKSGGDLDEWTDQLVSDSGSDAAVVDLGSDLPVQIEGGEHAHEGEEAHSDGGHSDGKGEKEHSEEKGHAEEAGHSEEEGHSEEAGETDPHWWHDPTNVTAATAKVETALISADPGATADFEAGAEQFRARIKEVDAAIAKCFDSIPADQRKLVTDHDALGYFANRYDVEVVGAVIPALTTQAEPSAGDLAELERTIREEGVKAVFPESSASQSLADAVAADTGATTEYSLYGDTLGVEDSGAETWLGMMRENANAMALGFTGGERGCNFS